MSIERLLKDQPILVVDGRDHLFIYDLEEALAAAGADVVRARDIGKALTCIKRFDFAACVLGVLPPDQGLVEELDGTPLLRLAGETVPEIVTKLTRMLSGGGA